MKTSMTVVFLFLVLCGNCFARIKLPSIISPNMVLQQDANVVLWGWADVKETVIFQCSWSQDKSTAVADANGKWSLKVRTPKAGGPYKLTFKGSNTIELNNVLIGEVWLCSGQSNMAWRVKQGADANEQIPLANYPQIRLLTIKQAASDKPLEEISGQWQECSPKTAGDFSAVGYYFGRKLHEQLKMPIGLINASWGGTPVESWTRRDILLVDDFSADVLAHEAERIKKFQQRREQSSNEKDANKTNHNKAGAIYNGMISPIIPYHIRGVIWNQGESNNNAPVLYRKLFSLLINSWRSQWGIGQFPFYYVQMPQNVMKPELRESQLLTLNSVQNTGMAVVCDGDRTMHPPNKNDTGTRLALWALAKTYGCKDLIYSGPLYRSFNVDGDKIQITFDHAAGLQAKGSMLKGFEIAGDDRKFLPAEANISGTSVIVSNAAVKKPVAVRYGWSKEGYAQCNLFNKAGLPASSFRTDNWPLIK